jgi:hypothetical protein
MSIKELSQSILDASKAVIELSEMKIGIQIVPGSERKLMPLAKKAGVRFMKPKPGDDEAHVMGDKKSIMKFQLSRGLSKDDILDVHPELKEETIEEKKLDPVGKADADIDNDGDTDSSDEYLHKRRAAIKKAMKDEGNKFTGALAKAKEMGEKTFTCAGKTYTVDEVEPIMKGDEEGKKKIVKEKDVKETTMMSGKPEKKSIAQVRRDMQKSVKDANQKLKDAEMRKKERLKKMQKMKEHLMPIIEEFGVEMISEIIGNVRMPDAGKDSSGIRKAVGKDSDSSGGMDNKEKVGYNALLSIAKKLEDAYKREENAESSEEEERAIDDVQKYKAQFQSKAKFYKDSTAAQARKDARK